MQKYSSTEELHYGSCQHVDIRNGKTKKDPTQDDKSMFFIRSLTKSENYHKLLWWQQRSIIKSTGNVQKYLIRNDLLLHLGLC